MSLFSTDLSILWPALIAGLLVVISHVPLGQQVLSRGIVFIDLAIAQVAGLGVVLADWLGFEPLGWAVQVYNAAEALPNLINPFWMLPLLGILGLKARDVAGFTIVQFVVHVPLVLFLLWLFGLTLDYRPPVMP